MEGVINKLLSFQIKHTVQMYNCLLREKCVLDASDTGTGKTYCTIAVCKLLNKVPLVICPKSVINTWIDVCNLFGVKIQGIANYEMLKTGKYYIIKDDELELTKFPFYNKNKDEAKQNNFTFDLPEDVIMIFDEAHRCKNYKSNTSKLLLSAHRSPNKIILLSATISDKIDCFRPFGVVFGLYDGPAKYKKWINSKITVYKLLRDKYQSDPNRLDNDNCLKKHYEYYNFNKVTNLEEITENEIKLQIIHSSIFSKYGSRMKIKELGDLFPQNNIISKCYYLENYKEVDMLHNEINNALNSLKKKETRSDALGKIIRAKQRIELLKIPIFQDLAEEALENGYSVVIFVNYRQTMNYLSGHLDCKHLIHGDQTFEERNMIINNFQNNKIKLIISIIQAGSVAISLHDIHGGHPRLSLISPTWSGQDMKQCLGRIHRAKSKSPAIQKIIFCAKTYEEKICNLVHKKLINVSAINDGDFVGPLIKTENINMNENINNEENDNADNEDVSFRYASSE